MQRKMLRQKKNKGVAIKNEGAAFIGPSLSCNECPAIAATDGIEPGNVWHDKPCTVLTRG